MSPDRFDPVTPAEARARDAVRTLAPPRADAAFRARLRQDFVAGRIGASRALALPWHRRAVWRAALVPALAALVTALIGIGNRGPEWTVRVAEGDGVAVVDQTPVPLGHAAEQAWRLRPGARVSVPAGSRLELASAGSLWMEIAGGAEATLPAPPGRWFGRSIAASVRNGVVRFSTGPRFRGATLRIDTPEAEVVVTGTTLAVICEPVGTCVCVFAGTVQMSTKGEAASHPIAAGHRRFVFNDGRPPESAEMRPNERERLGEVHAHEHGTTTPQR